MDDLDALIARGHRLREVLAEDAAAPATEQAVQGWQRDCAAIVGRLSGGSKSHWLARSYSAAFLVRGDAGTVLAEVGLLDIVERVLGVLDQAASSLAGVSSAPRAAASATAPDVSAPGPGSPRFDYVHDARLRPILEQAYREGRQALAEGHYHLALMTWCGLLEALVTDALDHAGRADLVAHGAPEAPIAAWPFATRIAVAERAGLIRGGCARLPPAALRYRDQPESRPDDDAKAETVSEREARTVSQVLRVVMRDLDPGR